MIRIQTAFRRVSIQLLSLVLGLMVCAELGTVGTATAEDGGHERKEGERDGDQPKREITMPFPQSVKAFLGEVNGEVESVDAQKGIMVLKVEGVGRAFSGSKAPFPEDLEGRSIKIACRGDKRVSGYSPNKEQQKFLHRLEKGRYVELMVKHLNQDQFMITELNQDQRRPDFKGGRWREGHWRDEWKRRQEEKERRQREEMAQKELEHKEGAKGVQEEGEHRLGDGDHRRDEDVKNVVFEEKKEERRRNDFDD